MTNNLVIACRSQSLNVVTVLDEGMLGQDDPFQLEYATAKGWVMYSYNVRDFRQLHDAYMREGKSHAGIILAPQQRFSVGEELRRIRLLCEMIPVEAMRNRLEFLNNWS